MADNVTSLHSWLYDAVAETCHDREYLYRAFVEHFIGIFGMIYDSGAITAGGSYTIFGLKGGPDAVVSWHLEHQLSFAGPNVIVLSASFSSPDRVEVGTRHASFDLATGEPVDNRLS